MKSVLVNLSVNPCKMCMPLGSVTAFCGIAGCMNLLHGSQGCSTYIRRHMSTHYNEPVDIASSSLTEEGTVFGGEKNLARGLDNLIKLYDPRVIGVSTTCLAETIGEDIPAMIRRYYETRPDCKVKIVAVSSAGYAGTQYEGWFRALRALVSQTGGPCARHEGVNVISGPMSPADARALKGVLRAAGFDFTLLPDISENLDRGFGAVYDRLPSRGTPLARIERMGGARVTLELAAFCPEADSPGRWLEEECGVPLLRLNPPVGLRDTDAFVEALRGLGAVIPEDVEEERARCLDAMIDAHKYNAGGRAAVFGEPDLVYGLVRLCCENGIVPVTAACGSACREIRAVLEEEIRPVAENALVERYSVLDAADFVAIEREASANGVNLLLGSSDGRRMSERLNIPLVRCAFPVHDHVGGQRIRLLGYSGATEFLERCANSLISAVDGAYRRELLELTQAGTFEDASAPRGENMAYQTHGAVLKESSAPREEDSSRRSFALAARRRSGDNRSKTATHPCFSRRACARFARIHLPVAPACNVSCNYCRRDFDCPNESRPGVATRVITPQEALDRFLRMKEQMPNISVAGIAGPGDALANFAQSAETLRLLRAADPDVTFCLSTNGLLLPQHADELIELGVGHVTITVNAVDPAIGSCIYRHVDFLGRRLEGESGAAVLMANQLGGLKYLADRGVVCKVNIVLIKGVNDGHIEEVVRRVKELGAYVTNIMQVIPVAGSVFADMPMVSNREVSALRKRCERHMPQMNHCRQCRADAVGLLNDDRSITFGGQRRRAGGRKLERMMRIAVASRSGVVVDQHFGHAERFYIYESDGDLSRLVETRRVGGGGASCGMCGERAEETPDPGRIGRAISAVSDCQGVLAMRIGDSPSRRLAERGISVFATYENIDKAVREAAISLRAG
ncbi:MAG: nitrogenase cofactor biosynthesis protein NifB [Desulfovibrio sp.]|jgi:nitrogenase molybdenum-iron protein alpha/beta subunit/molybdenum cofactor biosynthesis enzyme MoaA/predicted Fe-Mo cluster-binding NifX family protein|nr:nitrogenase cofactor biosynthesis protein NifB [Desulfovibrio sp.]